MNKKYFLSHPVQSLIIFSPDCRISIVTRLPPSRLTPLQAIGYTAAQQPIWNVTLTCIKGKFFSIIAKNVKTLLSLSPVTLHLDIYVLTVSSSLSFPHMCHINLHLWGLSLCQPCVSQRLLPAQFCSFFKVQLISSMKPFLNVLGTLSSPLCLGNLLTWYPAYYIKIVCMFLPSHNWLLDGRDCALALPCALVHLCTPSFQHSPWPVVYPPLLFIE